MRWDRGGSTRKARGSQTRRRRTIRASAGNRDLPFPRASVGSYSTPAAAEDAQTFRLPALVAWWSVASSVRGPVATPSSRSHISTPLLSAQVAAALSFPSPALGRVGARLRPYLPFLHPPQCHRPHDVPFQSIVLTASPPVRGCHIRCSISGPARTLRARAIRTQLAYVSGRQ